MTKYLEVNNLSYSYPDGHEALKDISFDLDNKESLAIFCLLYTSPSPRDQ